MRSQHKMALACAAGVFIGASGMSVLRAQTAAPEAYLVANIQEVKNLETYRSYQTAVTATQIAYGGHFLARGAKAVMLDKSVQPAGTIVIVAFPSMKNLQDWWNSPAYTAIRPIRESNTVSQIYAVEGLPRS